MVRPPRDGDEQGGEAPLGPGPESGIFPLRSAKCPSRRGPEWFARLGTATSKGTKIFSLVGKGANTGLVEIPMGMTLRELVEEIGGGALPQREIKAVQIGGPSGGMPPEGPLRSAD